MNENYTGPTKPELGNNTDRNPNLLSKVGDFAYSRALLVLNPGLYYPESVEVPRGYSDLEQLVIEENDFIDIRQKAHQINILRDKPSSETDHATRTTLADNIIQELSACSTIRERFDVFMDPRYADDIYSLDLGETHQAGSHEAVAALKAGYVGLKDALIKAGVIADEIPRDEAKRTIVFRTSRHPDYYVADRNRVLFCFEQNGRKIAVLKRQTFLIEKVALPGKIDLDKQDGVQYLDEVQSLIDREAAVITPVRTHYFATNQEIKA